MLSVRPLRQGWEVQWGWQTKKTGHRLLITQMHKVCDAPRHVEHWWTCNHLCLSMPTAKTTWIGQWIAANLQQSSGLVSNLFKEIFMICPVRKIVCRSQVTFFNTFKNSLNVILRTFDVFNTNLTHQTPTERRQHTYIRNTRNCMKSYLKGAIVAAVFKFMIVWIKWIRKFMHTVSTALFTALHWQSKLEKQGQVFMDHLHQWNFLLPGRQHNASTVSSTNIDSQYSCQIIRKDTGEVLQNCQFAINVFCSMMIQPTNQSCMISLASSQRKAMVWTMGLALFYTLLYSKSCIYLTVLIHLCNKIRKLFVMNYLSQAKQINIQLLWGQCQFQSHQRDIQHQGNQLEIFASLALYTATPTTHTFYSAHTHASNKHMPMNL